MCHMMFWPCDTKIAPKRWQLTVPINPDLPPYPETEEEILSTNALREEKWRAAVKAYRDGWGVRKYSCGRHSSQDLSEITQYTPCSELSIIMPKYGS